MLFLEHLLGLRAAARVGRHHRPSLGQLVDAPPWRRRRGGARWPGRASSGSGGGRRRVGGSGSSSPSGPRPATGRRLRLFDRSGSTECRWLGFLRRAWRLTRRRDRFLGRWPHDAQVGSSSARPRAARARAAIRCRVPGSRGIARGSGTGGGVGARRGSRRSRVGATGATGACRRGGSDAFRARERRGRPGALLGRRAGRPAAVRASSAARALLPPPPRSPATKALARSSARASVKPLKAPTAPAWKMSARDLVGGAAFGAARAVHSRSRWRACRIRPGPGRRRGPIARVAALFECAKRAKGRIRPAPAAPPRKPRKPACRMSAAGILAAAQGGIERSRRPCCSGCW